MKITETSVAERYDHALRYARHRRLPSDAPRPQPTAAWPLENIALLEEYRAWLLSSGTSPQVIQMLYIPMAGHVLGLSLKPHPQLDLEIDLEPAMAYIEAKQLSSHWTKICRNALEKFRRFLRQQRGYPEISPPLPEQSYYHERYCTGLPEWLVEALTRYQHLRQANWRRARLHQNLMRFWRSHTRLWRWLVERYPLTEPRHVKRQYIFDYIDACLVAGYAVSSINHDIRCFEASLRYLQEQDYLIPQALLRLPTLKPPDSLPRFLTDEQVRRLCDDFEQRVSDAASIPEHRDALLDRAVFYLLWQGGLRLSEVEELVLEELDLAGRKLTVRQSKGLKDRPVYLTDTAIGALEAYLAVRGMGPTSHVFLYRNRAVRKDLIHSRLRAAGQRVGVKVSAHRLRHTCATQLLNVGCRVTSIQSLLGHRRLNSTMIYARVHDHTVAQDYYTAMTHIEQNLDPAANLAAETDEAGKQLNAAERAQLQELLKQLADPHLGLETRLVLVDQVQRLLQRAEDSAE